MELKVWQMHSSCARIEKAEKTCLGLANKGGVKWCGPYSSANKLGFWLYSPVSFEFTYSNGKIEYNVLEEYSGEDGERIIGLMSQPGKENLRHETDKLFWCAGGRTKFTWGTVEPNVIQIWTGLIFQTPKNICLHIREPINFPRRDFHVMEGILETDWMQYDIWVNIIVDAENKKVVVKKDVPLAHLTLVDRSLIEDNCTISSEMINRDSKQADEVFKYWIDYNKKKFESGGKQLLTPDGSFMKDSTTFFKERAKALGIGRNSMFNDTDESVKKIIIEGQDLAQQEAIKKCPYAAMFGSSVKPQNNTEETKPSLPKSILYEGAIVKEKEPIKKEECKFPSIAYRKSNKPLKRALVGKMFRKKN
jgi:hypothetical protein